jgi:hypothetical protein
MMDLTPYTGRGFPGDIDRMIAEVPVAGIDREQTLGMVRLCSETEATLYGQEFSPTRLVYEPGSRPILEAVTENLHGDTARERARAAMGWTRRNVRHAHLVGPLPPDPDRAMGEGRSRRCEDATARDWKDGRGEV